MATWRRLARVDEIPEGRGIALEVEGKRVALFNIEGEFFAVEATCTQHRAPLNRGVVQDQILHCPWHGVPFDVAKGICSAFPGEQSAVTYPVRIEGNEILLAI